MSVASKFDHAKLLADHGYSVIPVGSDKRPCIKWSDHTSRVANDNELKQWFANFPDRNIGIVTGKVSGLVVLDIDDPSNFDLKALPATRVVKTSRGYHYYFNHPGFDVGNLVKIETLYGFCDVRGDGGYVIAPPSVHENGTQYSWVDGLDTPIADMPAWLIEVVTRKPNSAPVAHNDNQRHDIEEPTAYGKAWLKDVEELARTTSGGRNNLLNQVACKAGSLYAANQIPLNWAWSHMVSACKRNGLWIDKASGGPNGCDATIRSGWNEGIRNPRELSESDYIPVDDTPSPGRLAFKAASAFKAAPVPWLWKPVLVKGGMTFLAGEAGQGKSTIAFDIVARITNGDNFPASEGERFERGNVIYVSNEDDPNYTIIPRLTAAGADLDRVFIPEGKAVDEKGERTFELRADVKAIEEILEDMSDVRLVIIDPFNSYLGKADINDMGQMRSILNPYAELAQKYQVPILFVHHFNKGSGNKASNRMVGSTALRAAARTVYFVERDPIEEDKRILVCDKNNLAKDVVEYHCTIKMMDLGDSINATYLEWDGDTYRRTSDEVLLDAQNAPAQKKAMELIRKLFAETGTDTLEAKVIREACQEAGIHNDILYKAKQRLGLIANVNENDKRLKTYTLPKAA